MKSILLGLLILSGEVFGQNENSLCKAIDDISVSERNARQRNFLTNGSLASTNFQVIYYRCIWDIDPANRYIKGNITSHFITNAISNSISVDLSSQLTVDSIYYHGNKISFSSLATDVLQINFPAAINAWQKDSVTIFYKGTPSILSNQKPCVVGRALKN